MTDEQIVATAAAWLDVRHPGWHEKIDLDSFNIRDGQKCVGGQIGVRWTTLTLDLMSDHPERQREDLGNAFAMGQDLWIVEIAARQLTSKAQPEANPVKEYAQA